MQVLRPLLAGPVLAVAGEQCMVLLTLSNSKEVVPLAASVVEVGGSQVPDAASVKAREDGLYEVQLSVDKVRDLGWGVLLPVVYPVSFCVL